MMVWVEEHALRLLLRLLVRRCSGRRGSSSSVGWDCSCLPCRTHRAGRTRPQIVDKARPYVHCWGWWTGGPAQGGWWAVGIHPRRHLIRIGCHASCAHASYRHQCHGCTPDPTRTLPFPCDGGGELSCGGKVVARVVTH